jgi:hypothetical protein
MTVGRIRRFMDDAPSPTILRCLTGWCAKDFRACEEIALMSRSPSGLPRGKAGLKGLRYGDF